MALLGHGDVVVDDEGCEKVKQPKVEDPARGKDPAKDKPEACASPSSGCDERVVETPGHEDGEL